MFKLPSLLLRNHTVTIHYFESQVMHAQWTIITINLITIQKHFISDFQ